MYNLAVDLLRIATSLEVVLYHWNMHRYKTIDAIACTCNAQFAALVGFLGGSNIVYLLTATLIIPILYSLYLGKSVNFLIINSYWFVTPCIIGSLCVRKRKNEDFFTSVLAVVFLVYQRSKHSGEETGYFGFISMALIGFYSKQLNLPKAPILYFAVNQCIFVLCVLFPSSSFSCLNTLRTISLIIFCDSTNLHVQPALHRICGSSLIVYLLDKHPQRIKHADESIGHALLRYLQYILAGAVFNTIYYAFSKQVIKKQVKE